MKEEYKDLRFVTDEEIDRDMFPDSFVREYNAYFAGRAAAETAPETTDEIPPAEAKQQPKTHSAESAEEEWIDL